MEWCSTFSQKACCQTAQGFKSMVLQPGFEPGCGYIAVPSPLRERARVRGDHL
jgi:hypothetical protein